MSYEIQVEAARQSFAASRREGLAALRSWIELGVSEYRRNRSFVRPGHAAVSGLSPYLASRLILETEVIAELRRVEPPERATTFVHQLAWRTYWKGWLEHRPEVWSRFLSELEALEEGATGSEDEAIRRAEAGETGIECFDHWVAELRATGYLHNQTRLWFASIWMFTLQLPWQRGAAFFLRHLLDGDAASNTLSWRWVAGLHTPGKHYVAKAETIRVLTDGRFDPEGLINERPASFTEACDRSPTPLSRRPSADESLRPDISASPAGLLVTADDLSPEVGGLAEAPFQSVGVFAPADVLSRLGGAARVQAFRTDGLRDAARRAAGHWGGEVIELNDSAQLELPVAAAPSHVSACAPMRVYFGEVEAWIPAVVAWARRERLRTVRMFDPPVGLWRDQMPALQSALRRNGIALRRYRRRWDEVHWPHAQAGYFKFSRDLEERLAVLQTGSGTDAQ